MKKQLISIILVILIISTPLTYAQVTGTSDPEASKINKEDIPQGEDILINVAGYQPPVVAQQAFETDDYSGYPVYALLTGLQTNPFIDISKIRTISYRVVNSNVNGIGVYTRNPPLKFSLDNLGMVVIRLPKIKDERKIPDRIDINMSATILYDIGKGFGVNDVGINIPQLTEQEFLQNKNKYAFWAGRGYVKADTIEDNRATFTIYDGRGQKVRSGISLAPGQDSGEISLNAGYFLQGYGNEELKRNLRERFVLKLDEIDAPRDRAKLQILVNDKFITNDLSKNQRLYDGSSWKIKDIKKTDNQDRVELYNEDTKEATVITGSKLYAIDCSVYNDKDLCNNIPGCYYNTTLNKCDNKIEVKNIPNIQTPQISVDKKLVEDELSKAIIEFKKLNPSSTYENFKTVVDVFANVMVKYKDSVYANTARSFIYKNVYDYNFEDKNITDQVRNYIGTKLNENGISVNLPNQVNGNENSKDYYKKAIEDYKQVINYKYQDKDKAFDAQLRIAEIYDYYLNDPQSAIEAYFSLINEYGLNDLEKANYQSRIEFLQNVGNYQSEAIDLYEDGNLVRVILHGVEKTSEKPTAFISKNEQPATKYEEGDSLTESWKIETINGNKVDLISTKTNSLNQFSREQLNIDRLTVIDGTKFKLIRVDTKREAHVTVKPILKALTSISNFKLHIPVERRLIKLSDEQIDNQVASTKKVIESLNSAIDKVEKVYTFLSYYCYSVFSFLFVKNLVQGFGARHFARQETLDQWQDYCNKNNINDCEGYIFKNSKDFDDDISKMQTAVQRSDKIFNKIKDAKENCGSLDISSINDEYKDQLTKIDPLVVRKYCDNIQLDKDKEIMNEGDLRKTLLEGEKANLNLNKDITLTEREKNQLSFIDQSINLDSSKEISRLKEEKRNLFLKKDGQYKSWDELNTGPASLQGNRLEDIKANNINKNNWEANNGLQRQTLVDNYIANKEREIVEDARTALLKDATHFHKALNPKDEAGVNDKIDVLLKSKSESGKIFEKEVQDITPNNINLQNNNIPVSSSHILRTDKHQDWFLDNTPIYVYSAKEENNQKTFNAVSLNNYLTSDQNAQKAFAKDDGYDYNALKEYLKSKNSYLTIKENDKFTTIDVKEGIASTYKYENKIEIETFGDTKYIKTITIGNGYYLESQRNAQNVITNVELWRSNNPNDVKDDIRIDQAPISQCSEMLSKRNLPIQACSDLINADRSFIKDPKKIGATYAKYKIDNALKQTTGGLECLHVMGAQDCKWLFSACDPVMCPVSRFTYGGNHVDNVVGSGIFGSIYLGLDLWQPFPPEIGICVPGVLAGLKNIRSLAQGYQQCLLVKKEKGENVGICDTIFNIGICKVVWREAYTFFNIESGILGALFRKANAEVYGGGEYAFFYENIKKSGEFVSFFTNQYATTFFNAFRGSSTQEIGDSICEYAIYGKLPGGGNFIDQLTRPEGPPQFIAIMDEVPHADVGRQKTSDYSVFYHIYAGESYPQIRYYIYLHDIEEQISPATIAIAPRFGFSGVSTGYLNRGDFISDTVRLSDLPTGYDEVCVVINNVKKCGFGKVSSDLGINLAQEKIVKDQIEKNDIKSEHECVPDSSLVSQFSGAGPLQVATGVGGEFLGSGLSSTGVVRKCSGDNPGLGKDEGRWEKVGTCGKDSKGRDLGTCWLDKNSLNLLSETARKDIEKNLEDTTKLNQQLKALDTEKDNQINKIKDLIKSIKTVTDYNKEINQKIKDINNVIDDYNAVLSKTINPEIIQGAYFSIGELHENIASLLRAKEILQQEFKIDSQLPGEKPRGVGELICELEYEEGRDSFNQVNSPPPLNALYNRITSPSSSRNLFYRYNNGWELKEPKGYYKTTIFFGLSETPFKDWTKIDENTCKNEAFNYYDPIYRELCQDLIGKSDDEGAKILASTSNRGGDDYLIIHNQQDITIAHGQADINKIKDACANVKTKEVIDKTIKTDKPLIAEVILKTRGTFGLRILANDYNFKWNSFNWYSDSVSEDVQLGKLRNYENGIISIRLLAERLKKNDDFSGVRLECKQNTNTGIYLQDSNENLEKWLRDNIKNLCGYPKAYAPETLSQTTLDKLKSYDHYIDIATVQAYNQYSVAIPKNLVKAVMLQESGQNLVENALGYCGEAGLMQQLPDLARSLGINVPTNYETSVEPKCSKKEVSNCRLGKKDNCRPSDDERFNPEKSILVGTLYLAQGYQKSGNFEYTAAYYNGGPGAILDSKSCLGLKRYECDTNTDGYQGTRDYVKSVLGYKEFLDNFDNKIIT